MTGRADMKRTELEMLRRILQQLQTMTGIQERMSEKLFALEGKQPEHEVAMDTANNLYCLKQQFITFAEAWTEEKNLKQIASDAFKYRKKVKQQWTLLRNMRKIAYYNSIRSGGIQLIYENFLEREPSFIPRKFRQKAVPGETSAQKIRRIHIGKEKLKAEICRLQEQTAKQQDIMNNVEISFGNLIRRCICPIVKDKVREIWTLEIQDEELKSDGIWAKKREWFEKMPTIEEQNFSDGTNTGNPSTFKRNNLNVLNRQNRRPQPMKARRNLPTVYENDIIESNAVDRPTIQRKKSIVPNHQKGQVQRVKNTSSPTDKSLDIRNGRSYAAAVRRTARGDRNRGRNIADTNVQRQAPSRSINTQNQNNDRYKMPKDYHRLCYIGTMNGNGNRDMNRTEGYNQNSRLCFEKNNIITKRQTPV